MRVDDRGRIFIPDFGSYRVQVYQKDVVPLSEADIIPPLQVPYPRRHLGAAARPRPSASSEPDVRPSRHPVL